MVPLSKQSPSSLIHFLILLYHASMHCWKDSSGMLLSSVVTAVLMASTSSKWVPLIIPLGKKKKSHRARSIELNWLFQYNDITLCQELLNAQHTKSYYFSDMPKFLLIIFQTLFFFMFSWLANIQTVNRWSPYTTCLSCTTLTSVLLDEGLLLLE